MAFGLQVRNASNQIRLDTTDRTFRLWSIATISTTADNTNLTVSVPGMRNDGTWEVLFQTGSTGNANMPTISLNSIYTNGYSVRVTTGFVFPAGSAVYFYATVFRS